MVASRHSSTASVRRDAWVEVDLGALEHNIRVIRSWLPETTELMAVVKCDGYGHGAAGIAPVVLAAGARWLGVASVDEGLDLRQAGIRAPIVILSPCPFWATSNAVEADLDVTITSKRQVQDLINVSRQVGKRPRVHVKVDTGMHRLGLDPAAASDLAASIHGESALQFVGLYSHLARPDDMETTGGQNNGFRQVLQSLVDRGLSPQLVHLASGEAARRFPDTHYDLVRVGLYVYGLEPQKVSDVVTPAMSVRARINHLRELEPGEAVGYDLTWAASRRSIIASIPIGYGDGVDRRLSNKMTGLLNGTEVRQVGRISMDQLLFDVTDVPQAQGGDVITLIGRDTGLARAGSSGGGAEKAIQLATWANMLDTITYELACRLRVRLPRIYTRHQPSSVKSEGG